MSIKNKTLARTFVKKITGRTSFGDMILSYRQAQEITQVAMAEKLGVSKQDLCNIEKNRKLVSVERAVSFAKSLGMPIKTFAKYALQDQLYKAGIKAEVDIKDAA